MCNIGSFAGYYTLGWFLTHSKERFLLRMKHNARTPVTPGVLTAWANTFDVLREAVSQLPESYRNFHIVMEYGLPRSSVRPDGSMPDIAVYADAVIVTRHTVAVLEFKQMTDPYIGYVRQARKYRNRIQKYHEESRGMTKRSLLVLTKGKNVDCDHYRVHCCSADNLAEAIVSALGEAPHRHSDIKRWCYSEFVASPLKKPKLMEEV